MKMILFYAPSFWYRTFEKVLEDVPEAEVERACAEAVVVFYQVEAGDVKRRDKVLVKWAKNVKWLARKFDAGTVVLHSFNHLSPSKAPAPFAHELVEAMRARLEGVGFAVHVTPFGYLNEWKLHVAGESLAKVFKEI